MALQITLAKSEDVSTYVPDFADNRELAADGRPCLEVDIVPMSGADYDRLQSATMGGKRAKGSDFMRRAAKLVQRVIDERVVAVRGFEVCDAAGNVVDRPATGAALYRAVMAADAAAGALIDDIFEAIRDASVLGAGDLGKLRPPSGISSPKARQNDGGAARAAPDPTPIPTAGRTRTAG